jgi:hypothetical protein
MTLSEYFEQAKGVDVLATSSGRSGVVLKRRVLNPDFYGMTR